MPTKRPRVRLRGALPSRPLLIPLGGMRLLTDLYNRKPKRHAAAQQQGALAVLRAVVDSCAGLPVGEPIPSAAMTRFNDLSVQAPVHLTIEETEAHPTVDDDGVLAYVYDGPHKTEAVMEWADYRGYVLQVLWHWLQHPARDRLKRCPCGRAFVDGSKNHRRVYCSQVCHDREWTYAKRKTAGHQVLKRPSARIRKNSPRIRTARRLD
jgi:hypothetical protein